MISIRKYLNQQSGTHPQDNAALSTLCSTLLQYIAIYVFSGESAPEMRSKIEALQASVHPQLQPAESQEIQDSVRRILAQHSASMQDAATRTAVDMRQLAGLLTQAVGLVASGGERSTSGLEKIQNALQRASKITDFAGLRASLAETIRIAGEESARQQTESEKELATFQTGVAEARQLVAQNPNQRLQGRPEGVRKISEGLKSVVPDHALYVVAFAFDNLNAIVHRYGPDAVEDVIFRLIRERIQPLARANLAYRWTPQSLVGVFERPRDLSRVRSEASALNRAALVHRVSLGNRIAVLTLSPSHLVAEGQAGMPEALIEEVDFFTGAHA